MQTPQISEGIYATYAALASDWDNTGVLISNFATFAEALSSCNVVAACIGIKSNGSTWRTFDGNLQEGTLFKVRLAGEAINPWIAEPPAN